MVNAQEWLENQEQYNTKEKREKVTEIHLTEPTLAGELNLSDFNYENYRGGVKVYIYLTVDASKLTFINQPKKASIIKIVNAQEWLDQEYPQEGVYISKNENYKFNNGKTRAEITLLSIKEEGLFGELKLIGFNNLTGLICSNNQLTKLDLTPCAGLTYLSCYKNCLTTLDVSCCLNLEELYCENNNLTSIDLPKKYFLSKYPSLEKLNCSENNLTSLNVKNCLNLKEILCNDNFLVSSEFLKTISQPWKLIVLSVNNNNFNKQNLAIFSKFINLKKLLVGNDKRKRIEDNIYNRWTGFLEQLSDLKQLQVLDIDNTNITGSLEHLSPNLEKIYCSSEEKLNSEVKEIADQLKSNFYFDLVGTNSRSIYGANWKDIQPEFTLHLKKQWVEKEFDYEQTKKWINADVGLEDSGYAQWLRDAKNKTAEWVLRHDNKEELKTEYEKHLSAVTQDTQISAEIIRKVKDFVHDKLTSNQESLVNELISNKELRHRYKKCGLCHECHQPCNDFYHSCSTCGSEHHWCPSCNAWRLQKNFGKLTSSGNEVIDKFIQEQQMKAINPRGLLQWIPYENFANIEYLAEGGFGKVYRAKWMKGETWYYFNKSGKWAKTFESQKRNYEHVVLKSLNNSQSITSEFLREIINHKLINCNLNAIAQCYGISQDPVTKGYIMVIQGIEKSNSLRQRLKDSYDKVSFQDKLRVLHSIALSLESIHEQGLSHCDLHPGNIIIGSFNNKELCFIIDLGLCRPVSANNDGKVYGVLPYVAPEVLRGEPYTQATDIYSFGIIAYEVLSGLPPYHNIIHDGYLGKSICQGMRPNLDNFAAPPLLKNFIELCWDANPLQRPKLSVNQLRKTFDGQVKFEGEDIVIVKGSEFDQQMKTIEKNNLTSFEHKIHLQIIHTSRLLDFPNLPQPQNNLSLEWQTTTLLGLQIKGIKKELEIIKEPLENELAELVGKFIEIKKKSLKDKGDKQVKKHVREIKKQLEEKDLSEEKANEVIRYCEKLVELEQQLEQENLQTQIEIPTNK